MITVPTSTPGFWSQQNQNRFASLRYAVVKLAPPPFATIIDDKVDAFEFLHEQSAYSLGSLEVNRQCAAADTP